MYNKEKLYEIYLAMKKDPCEGYKFSEKIPREELYGNDENCEIIHFIYEGSMEMCVRITIPDKNIN